MIITYSCWLDTAGEASALSYQCSRDYAALRHGVKSIAQDGEGTVCARRYGDERVHVYRVDRTRLRTVATLIAMRRAS